uniref:MepB family protein n=1 Tax=Flavobacterium sp. TaxID=239 RepID=UPI00404A8F85
MNTFYEDDFEKAKSMNKALSMTIENIFEKLNLMVSEFKIDAASSVYDGCEFKLDTRKIIYRTAKTTPKKAGQFVTFWKRNAQGITEPFSETDVFDFYVINLQSENQVGQFVFPKSKLIEKGIVSSAKKDGKRGFRVYAIWDKTTSKQAIEAQKWQLNYFFELNEPLHFEKIKKLFTIKL